MVGLADDGAAVERAGFTPERQFGRVQTPRRTARDADRHLGARPHHGDDARLPRGCRDPAACAGVRARVPASDPGAALLRRSARRSGDAVAGGARRRSRSRGPGALVGRAGKPMRRSPRICGSPATPLPARSRSRTSWRATETTAIGTRARPTKSAVQPTVCRCRPRGSSRPRRNEVAIANLAPSLTRRPDPADVTEVLQWAGEPLATAEVAAVCGIDREEAREQLGRVATEQHIGFDGLWSL